MILAEAPQSAAEEPGMAEMVEHMKAELEHDPQVDPREWYELFPEASPSLRRIFPILRELLELGRHPRG